MSHMNRAPTLTPLLLYKIWLPKVERQAMCRTFYKDGMCLNRGKKSLWGQVHKEAICLYTSLLLLSTSTTSSQGPP